MKITQTAIRGLLKKPGRHGDGHGLFLRVVSPKKAYWTYQYRVAGRVREKSLGSYPEIGLAEARVRHADLRKQVVADGADPLRNDERGQAWKGHLSHLLPNPSEFHEERHHAAMPYADVPSFMRELKEAPGVAPQALAFAILTAARGAEAVGATWDEIDWDARTWVVPARRMKTRVEHTVPLSDLALEVLQERWKARRERQGYVFPGRTGKAPLSERSMGVAMRRLRKYKFTAHGFRSSFRDWAAESGVDDSVAEQCLAHKVGNDVTRAYLRSTVLERRRVVIQAWASHLSGEGASEKVIPLRR
jgi:integrase